MADADVLQWRVEASANGYTGASSAWFVLATLREFAETLRAYPLVVGAKIASGFGADPEHLDEEHVGVDAYRVGSRGQVGLRVRLSTPHWPDDRVEAQQSVELELLTTYERLRDFSDGLVDLIDGSAESARIEEETLV